MNIKDQIIQSFSKWRHRSLDSLEALNSGSASNRQYFKIEDKGELIIATYNQDIRENEAFFYLADFFRTKGVQVPKVHYISKDRNIYFQQYVGEECLLDQLKRDGLSPEVKRLYKESLAMLVKMQTSVEGLDFSKCYPRPSFDTQSILWDLNYFKYYFLKVSGIEFDEQLLENDFQFFAQYLSKNEEPYFMFRDFQARNIQILDGKPWLIDFQGGRRGPLTYDVASLLYQSSADLSQEFRRELIDFYFHQLPDHLNYSRKQFDADFKNILLIRLVQVLGAYGYRGIIEGKPYFKNSIPNALDNLQTLLLQLGDDVKVSYFLRILAELVQIKNKFEN